MIIYQVWYYLETIQDWLMCGMYTELETAQEVTAKLNADGVRNRLEWHEIY